MRPKSQKAPAGAFWRSSLMHFYSGTPMHFLSGVDTEKLEWIGGSLRRVQTAGKSNGRRLSSDMAGVARCVRVDRMESTPNP
jgi:hypothetical protein